jgi:hypothetical protein
VTGEDHPANQGQSELPAGHETLYAELRPLLQRLLRQQCTLCGLRRTPEELHTEFVSVLGSYDPARGIPVRPYLARHLSAALHRFPGVGEGEDAPGRSARTVFHLVRKLPGQERQSIVWRYYDGLTLQEIGARLRITPAAAGFLVRRALSSLCRRTPTGL